MFTLYEVDDCQLVVRSADPGDIARIFRLLGYDLPVPSGTRINAVYVTILRETLTEGDSHAKITDTQPEPDDEPQLDFLNP